MKTKVITINPLNINLSHIKEAACKIRAGGLVAFPTETVYGLGADAFNCKAVAKIFEAKNRPREDPLIVHIAKKEDLYNLAEDIPDIALKLADKFWPGPLTLVLKKSKYISDIVSGGLNTIAIRMPSNSIALALIKFSKRPIAAPSANLFARPSPTTAWHVLEDLNGKIDIVIDGGKTSVGVESTILDLTQQVPFILRPGGISIEVLKTITPNIELYQGNHILSPGMFKRHYSPKAKLIVVERDHKPQAKQVKSLAYEFIQKGYSVGIMAKMENKDQYNENLNVKILGSEKNLAVCAANLYSILREFDREGTQIIIAEGLTEKGLGTAIMDRLKKAAAKDFEGDLFVKKYPPGGNPFCPKDVADITGSPPYLPSQKLL